MLRVLFLPLLGLLALVAAAQTAPAQGVAGGCPREQCILGHCDYTGHWMFCNGGKGLCGDNTCKNEADM